MFNQRGLKQSFKERYYSEAGLELFSCLEFSWASGHVIIVMIVTLIMLEVRLAHGVNGKQMHGLLKNDLPSLIAISDQLKLLNFDLHTCPIVQMSKYSHFPWKLNQFWSQKPWNFRKSQLSARDIISNLDLVTVTVSSSTRVHMFLTLTDSSYSQNSSDRK